MELLFEHWFMITPLGVLFGLCLSDILNWMLMQK